MSSLYVFLLTTEYLSCAMCYRLVRHVQWSKCTRTRVISRFEPLKCCQTKNGESLAAVWITTLYTDKAQKIVWR